MFSPPGGRAIKGPCFFIHFFCTFKNIYNFTNNISCFPHQGGGRWEAQVAMVCHGRGDFLSQYMTPQGHWETPANQAKVTCLKDKVDILHLCKQVSFWLTNFFPPFQHLLSERLRLSA